MITKIILSQENNKSMNLQNINSLNNQTNILLNIQSITKMSNNSQFRYPDGYVASLSY